MSINEDLKNKIKFKIAMSEIDDEKNEKLTYSIINFTNKKIGFVACIFLLLTSSIVFAQNIESFITNHFGLGKGIETAINNGYIANPETTLNNTETTIINNTIDDIDCKIKIASFFMDDYNLSIEFEFQFDNEIDNYINFNNLNNIILEDLIITDESKRIVYSSADKDTFEKFCYENNLNHNYQEFSDNYKNNGLNNFLIFHNQNDHSVTLNYNMYSEGYPKSQKILLNFGKIKILENNNLNDISNIITLTGQWNITLDIPEKMYNRSYEYYEVVNCENKNFDIYTSKITDTGLEIGILISDITPPIYPEELKNKEKELLDTYKISPPDDQKNSNTKIIEYSSVPYENNLFQDLYTSSPYKEMYEDYWINMKPINVLGTPIRFTANKYTDGCYALNSKGEKFASTMSPTRKQNANFIDGNKFDFYETFSMTKLDATETITLIIDFKGNPVKIELKKI